MRGNDSDSRVTRTVNWARDFGIWAQVWQRPSWEKVLIYACFCLKNELHIYKKFGFQKVELEKDNPYERADMKLELGFNVEQKLQMNSHIV